ncbi:hypothetical protein JAAARDRAFT_715007 [Jaapia argillacea MUCL 33604]|uniref:Uncharacterized protein n=1 Tax=Jaapia argillacea MUCL 33604 TaxID=933084 RepID=A0A067Q8B6_9AGAM|nr:hypothetical protein JAAARDRAFT_715007 [Jaapia argillacea MUCL 33604]
MWYTNSLRLNAQRSSRDADKAGIYSSSLLLPVLVIQPIMIRIPSMKTYPIADGIPSLQSVLISHGQATEFVVTRASWRESHMHIDQPGDRVLSRKHGQTHRIFYTHSIHHFVPSFAPPQRNERQLDLLARRILRITCVLRAYSSKSWSQVRLRGGDGAEFEKESGMDQEAVRILYTDRDRRGSGGHFEGGQ